MANEKTRKLTLSAMFAAMAYLLMAIGRIPITSVDFLKYDPKDVILAIAGFVLGPLPALSITAVVALIEMLTVSTTGPIGLLMNILSSAAFVCPAALIYRRRHSRRGALIGLGTGIICMVALMLLWNYFITPLYMGYPREAVAAMLPTVFLPFNIVKGLLNAAVTVLIYKPISRALKSAGLVSGSTAQVRPGHGTSIGTALIAALVLVSCVFAALIMRGVL